MRDNSKKQNMKFVYTLLFIFTLSLFSSAQTNEELSIWFIKKLERQRFDSCFAMFDTSMANKFNIGMLEGMWGQIPKYMGEYKGYSTVESSKKDTIDIVAVRCEFVKTKMDLQFAFNKAQKIIGMYFVPPKNKNAYAVPEYAQPNKYYETKIAVKTGTMTLPGVLCVPNNITNPPLVILIAGSGPNDKDESIGPNKPLKDFAIGLASNGIATYRYDKRTLVYGKDMKEKEIDLNSEVIEDAVNTIKMLKKNADFKKSKVYVVGHSLGAMCAPLVASKTKQVNGIVLLAGNARPMEDLILEQVEYISSLTEMTEDDKKEIDTLKMQVANVKDLKTLKSKQDKDLPLNIPATYWLNLSKYKQVEVAKKIKQPILVLQGERDYQVTMTDFSIWKENLNNNPKNQFISYPALNHLFMKGEGKSTPSEYELQGNVDEKVIIDIADWIKKH